MSTSSISPGSTVGAYTVVEALGVGGMGEVWRARDTELERQVALKLLPPDFAEDAERHAGFERDAKVLASLNHPNIVTLYGLEHLGGQHVLVMELVGGEGLDELISRGPVPIEEALPIASQVAEALVFGAFGTLVAAAATALSLLRPAPRTEGPIHVELSQAAFKESTNAAISPDGRIVAYVLGADLSPLQLRSLDSLDVRTIAGAIDVGNPFVSPDGRWVAYASDESGSWRVYVRPYPGPGGRTRVSVDGDLEPLWSGNGSELFFPTDDAMMAVCVNLGEGLVFGRPTELFEDSFLRPLKISPDVHS